MLNIVLSLNCLPPGTDVCTILSTLAVQTALEIIKKTDHGQVATYADPLLCVDPAALLNALTSDVAEEMDGLMGESPDFFLLTSARVITGDTESEQV